MKIKCSEIKVGERVRKALGSVEGLAASIKELGLLQPIGITEDYELVFGERRLEACKSLNYEEIEVVIVNSDELLECETAENVSRKSFAMSERVEIRKIFKEKFMKEDAEKMKKGIKVPNRHPTKTRDRLAKLSGVGRDKAKKEDFIVAYKDKDIIDDVDNGKLAVNKAYNMIEKIKAKAKAQTDNKTDDLSTKESVDVEAEPIRIYDDSYSITLSDNYDSITFPKDLNDKLRHYSEETKVLPLMYLLNTTSQSFKDYIIEEEKLDE